jgi:hypothetical protein
MRKNQNNKKEEMFLTIELWQESKVSQSKFCNREGISYHTFKYWYKKYKFENDQSSESRHKKTKTFIPVEVLSEPKQSITDSGQIEVSFPNGIELSCPVDMDIQKLKTLLGV